MTETEYIMLISNASKTKSSELLVDCMNRYKVNNTKELSLKQLKEYWEEMEEKNVFKY